RHPTTPRLHTLSLHDALPIFVPPQAATATVDDAAPSQSGDTPTLFARTRAALPKIVLFWIVGVAALSFRLAGGWLRAQRLAKRRSEEHTSELQSPYDLVCRLL